MIIDRTKALGWLQPMLDDLGINLNIVMDVRHAPDRIVIRCAHTTDPDAERPPAVLATGELPDGLADMSLLTYEVELEIADLVHCSACTEPSTGRDADNRPWCSEHRSGDTA